MAVPTVFGVGAKGSGTGNVQYSFPASYQANDIGLLYIETDSPATISVNESWTQVADSPQTPTAAGTKLHVWWKRLSASETGPTATQGGTTNHQCGGIIVLRGCITSGNPWDVTAGGTDETSDTSANPPGDTTTGTDRLVLFATSSSFDGNTGQGSSCSNGDLTSVALTSLNYNTNAGNGGGVVVGKGEKLSAGAFGQSTITLSNATYKGLHTIALKPISLQYVTANVVAAIVVTKKLGLTFKPVAVGVVNKRLGLTFPCVAVGVVTKRLGLLFQAVATGVVALSASKIFLVNVAVAAIGIVSLATSFTVNVVSNLVAVGVAALSYVYYPFSSITESFLNIFRRRRRVS